MTDTTYNGWTNYETWRVNLEMFDGLTLEDMGYDNSSEPYDVGNALKSYAEDIIEQSSQKGLARDYAMSFMSNVNWYEIARWLIGNEEQAA